MVLTKRLQIRLGVLALMIAVIMTLHYGTHHHMRYYHAVYDRLAYLPLLLGSFWFGLRGALGVSLTILLLYSPFIFIHWTGFSVEDFNQILEMVLLLVMSLILGFLVERERKEHRARVHAESLAAVGTAVSEIAHDLKSPLIAIGGFARQVSRKMPFNDPNRLKLDVVIQESDRMESMINEMLDYGRPLELTMRETDLNRLIEECRDLAMSIAEASGVTIKTALDLSRTLCTLDCSRIKQVLMNVLCNAIQASPSGEVIWVKVHEEKGRVIIEVMDQGCGIPNDQLSKVFEPFFSTKKGGTGLGLPIVKKIIEAHGGSVRLSANPHGGITATVALPC